MFFDQLLEPVCIEETPALTETLHIKLSPKEKIIPDIDDAKRLFSTTTSTVTASQTSTSCTTTTTCGSVTNNNVLTTVCSTNGVCATLKNT